MTAGEANQSASLKQACGEDWSRLKKIWHEETDYDKHWLVIGATLEASSSSSSSICLVHC